MKKGSSLLIIIIIISTFLVLAALLTKIVYNNYSAVGAAVTRTQAFYLAEAGIEKGKVEIAHNSNWYTDLPYYLVDNDQWLIRYAVGQQDNLGDGSYKIVREKGKNRLYSVGYKGKGIVVLKISFSTAPFKVIEWSEL